MYRTQPDQWTLSDLRKLAAEVKVTLGTCTKLEAFYKLEPFIKAKNAEARDERARAAAVQQRIQEEKKAAAAAQHETHSNFYSLVAQIVQSRSERCRADIDKFATYAKDYGVVYAMDHAGKQAKESEEFLRAWVLAGKVMAYTGSTIEEKLKYFEIEVQEVFRSFVDYGNIDRRARCAVCERMAGAIKRYLADGSFSL